MKITREKMKELKIKLEGKYIEQVNSYKYLGVTFEEDGAMEMKYLRKVNGVNRLQRHRNEDIRRELEIQPITEYIEKRQLDWWGHLMRLPNNIPTRKIWEARSYGKRKRGRPEETSAFLNNPI
ncbi:hypothetical protein NQ318_021687 [Aromia moschata]|uniref:Uncharacterized protein n=1 Tax=Aromia moschata TaxID=1265417 RepID=A0AAV8YE68_9CUCU|nr:hypothetical protein NQ318_021687 [Aromia moschata]